MLGNLLQLWQVLRTDSRSVHVHVVIESIVDWRTIAQMTTAKAFTSLSQNVSRTVPEHLLCLIVFVKLEKLHRRVAFQRTIQIPQLKHIEIELQTIKRLTSSLTLAMIVAFDKLVLMPFATIKGVVSQALPSTKRPSGNVILMSSRGLFANSSLYSAMSLSNKTMRC